jgi:crotonobetainyl-CoA:carnitine CoA-transferase CaiB-like acyl-CoA transferase
MAHGIKPKGDIHDHFRMRGETMTRSGPLQGISVLDLSHMLSAPYGTMTLADLGAEVIRIERPGGGDSLRKSPSLQNNESAYYFCSNRNKKCMVVNLKTSEGIELIKRLVKDFDVFVENFRPGGMDRLGVGYETIKATKPDIVYASLTAFGDVGPYRDMPGYERILQSLAGVVSVTSEPDHPPSKVPLQIVDLSGGLFLSQAIMGALFHRQRTGKGQRVKTSLFEAIKKALWRCSNQLSITCPSTSRF